ncbi:MAG: hypothetical protein JWQ59_1486, partial [Cryobacterium sp.]|nr:hypothetical protein [Cryobacterium sp.]
AVPFTDVSVQIERVRTGRELAQPGMLPEPLLTERPGA